MLDTRQILQENLKALLETRPETSRLNLSREMQVGDGTLGSIQYGKGNPTLQVLETIAHFFGLETWQLLSPSLGYSSAIGKRGVHGRALGHWPFAGIKQEDFSALPVEEQDEIEHQIAYKVKRFKKSSIRQHKK